MAVLLPTSPVTFSRDLADLPNGRLLPSQLVTVGVSGWLHRDAARCWKMLKLDAEGTLGRPLTWTYGGTYRGFDAQAQVWRERMTNNPTPLQRMTAKVKKVWRVENGGDGKLWYLVRGAQVAEPGTSNHGKGVAIDVAYGTEPGNAVSVDNRWRDWAITNARKYGFSFETQSEIWHIRYVDGDRIPPTVVDLEAFFASPPAPAPAPLPPPAVVIPPFRPESGEWSLLPLAPHEDRPVLDLGSGLDPASPDRQWVLYVQWTIKLKTRFGPWTETSGVFSENTKAVVAALQADPLIHQYPDGIVGRDDWWWVDALGRPQ